MLMKMFIVPTNAYKHFRYLPYYKSQEGRFYRKEQFYKNTYGLNLKIYTNLLR